MEEQDTIDLGQVWQAARKNLAKLVGIAMTFMLIALVLAFVLPKQYESSVLIRAKGQKPGNGFSLQASAALAFLGGSTSSPVQAYQEMIKSRSVLDPVIARLDLPDKDNIDNEKFAKTNLKLDNPKGTDLLEITATGRSPEEAQLIASSVLESFQRLLTELNQSEQSMQMKFLQKQMQVAKGEMEQAEKRLEQYRQQTKIFVPDEQAKAIVKALSELDQKLAESLVEKEANEAKLQGVNSKLRQQNNSMEKFEIAENAIIDKIRTAIIDKQMTLVNLRQRYTDKHPEVVLTNKEIEGLTAKLREEIARSVQSEANILNPVQGALLTERIETETKIIAAQATADAIRRAQATAEKGISDLSSHSVTYIGLERQARISQEVYAVLVKSYEQARIQEAMDSMDIQVVDVANLPKSHSAPRKALLLVIGGLMGGLISFCYLLILYFRSSKSRPVLTR